MPEIKNVFRQGVMNKDDDERIIPNGQYRDAMNIEVSTSEDSDVGTVQNILGNTLQKSLGGVEQDFTCVGAIADEKNDTLYWFVTSPVKDMILEYHHDGTTTPVLVDVNKDVLQFDRRNIITGINIIDDLLFWTDNVNEPKKINITSCKEGTFNENTQTSLVVKGVNKGDIRLENVTVIKKRPTKAPDVQFVETSFEEISLLPGLNFYDIGLGTTITNYEINGTINDPAIAAFSSGDFLLLSDASTPGLLPQNYDIKILITGLSLITTTDPVTGSVVTTGYSYDFEIIEILKTYVDEEIDFNAVRFVDVDEIFEKDFVRFATRYKYVDGEFSAFSPFTQPVFVSGRFGFHPTKDPYNLGMENKLLNVMLENLIETGTPEDVVQLDILFKKDGSTTVYSIDSLKPTDFRWNDSAYIQPGSGAEAVIGVNSFGTSVSSTLLPSDVNAPRGRYEITVENVYAALPENQLLRSYDNVPRKALAQEITGNRLVYANYLQNYDNLDFNGNIATPEISITKEERSFDFGGGVSNLDHVGLKSIKSLRTYYLGIVYGDEYGRETPVFTSKDASISIDYEDVVNNTVFFNAEKSLRLTARINGTVPDWAHYFKYYIKQTSGEYYNLTLDRVYKVPEDENLWISFPSSDRNKIQEGDYFILKKQVDIESIVPVKEKIKIIDIKNEAPEFIRFNYLPLGTGGGTAADNEALFPDINQHPAEGVSKLLIDAESWIATEGGIDLEEGITTSDRLAVQFARTQGGFEQKSKKYFVSSYASIEGGNEGHYQLLLRNTIDPEDAWVESSPGVLNSTDAFRIIIFKLQEKEAPEFEGRFFVKVISNPVTQQYLIPATQDINNYRTTGRMLTYALTNSITTMGSGFEGIYNTKVGSNANAQGTTATSLTDTFFKWEVATKFDQQEGSNSGFFIDNMYFVAAQEDTGTYFNAAKSGRMTKGDPLAYAQGAPNVLIPNQYVNGLEGIVTVDVNSSTSPYYIDSSGTPRGPRHWSKNAIMPEDNQNNMRYKFGPHNYDNTYVPTQTGHFVHLSFACPGEDLHDGDLGPSNHAQMALDNGNNSSLDAHEFPGNYFNSQGIYTKNGFNYGSGVFGSAINTSNYPNESLNWEKVADFDTANHGQWNIVGAEVKEANENQFNPAWKNPYAASVIANLIPGSRFQIEGGSGEIFTILKINTKYLYNHTAWQIAPTWLPTGNSCYTGIPVSNQSENIGLHPYAVNGNIIALPSVCEAWSKFISSFSSADYEVFQNTFVNFGKANNRRTCYIMELDKDINSFPQDKNALMGTANAITDVQLIFVDNYIEEGQNTLPTSPAIFETEAKEEVDLNIYFEASDAIPVKLRNSLSSNPDSKEKGYLLAPVGSKVTCTKPGSDPTAWDTINITSPNIPQNYDLFLRVVSWNGNEVTLSNPGLNFGTTGFQQSDYLNHVLRFTKEDGSYTEATIIGVNSSNSFVVFPNVYKNKHGLGYYNCFSFGNGVESNRIRDDFNQTFIQNGVRASAVLEQPYEEEHRKYGLIYSGLYNSTSGVNNLNQFIQAEKITKDVNPTFGSIQKLYSRTKDLVTLCEDKVLQIFVDRDLLFNADGQQQLLTSDRFLGTTQPFAGNYGISKNPESFAAESFRAYFTDKQRGAVLRLSRDGLTPISDAGMTDYFRDELKNKDVLYGSYDAYKKDYNLSMLTFVGNNIIQNSNFTTGDFNQVTLNEELLNNSFDVQSTLTFPSTTYQAQSTAIQSVVYTNTSVSFYTANLPPLGQQGAVSPLEGLYIIGIDLGNDGSFEYDFWNNVGGTSIQAEVTSVNVAGLYTTVNLNVVEMVVGGQIPSTLYDMVSGLNTSLGADTFIFGPLSSSQSTTSTDDWAGINDGILGVNNNNGTLEVLDGQSFIASNIFLDINKLYRVEVEVGGGPMWGPGSTNTPSLIINNQTFNLQSNPQAPTIPAPGIIIDDMTSLVGTSGNGTTFEVTGGDLNIESISIKELVPQGGTVLNWDLDEGPTEDGELEFLLNPRRVSFNSTSTDLKRLSQIITGHDFEQNAKYRLKFKISNYQSGNLNSYLRTNAIQNGIDFGSVGSNGNFDIVGEISSGNTALNPPLGQSWSSAIANRIIFQTTNFIGDIDDVELYLDGFSGTTVTFNEKSKGWTSFKSFVPEIAISSVNQYYTMLFGELWKHHTNQSRNTFYNDFTESSITPVLNLQPELVKHFNTLNYEGTKSKIDANGFDNDYYNLADREGWYVDNIRTNKQEGTINEFIEKEGKWYNYIKGTQFQVDTSAFNFQGIGVVTSVDDLNLNTGDPVVFGCTNPNSSNYNPNANVDDGSCDVVLMGCTDPNALNYFPAATVDDGSCVYNP